MRQSPTSEKKQKLFDEINNQPLKVGDIIEVERRYVGSRQDSFPQTCEILNVTGDVLLIKRNDGQSTYTVNKNQIIGRQLYNVGVNPFSKKDRIQNINFTLESIVFGLNLLGDKNRNYEHKGFQIKECNFNPVVIGKEGDIEYYQRPYVWTIEDNQLLVESIYNHVDCGKVLVRERSWSEFDTLISKGVTELSFKDVVDGKQRLNAVRGFLLNEFSDLNGNYYNDLSYSAQSNFLNHQLFSYSVLPENSKDEDVIYQFLKLNFAGKPQSTEHIEYIKSLYNKLK